MTATITPSDALLARIQAAEPVPRPDPAATNPYDRRIVALARKLGHLFIRPDLADGVTDAPSARLLIDALGLHPLDFAANATAIGYPTGWVLQFSDLEDYHDEARMVVTAQCSRCQGSEGRWGVTRLHEVNAMLSGHVCGRAR